MMNRRSLLAFPIPAVIGGLAFAESAGAASEQGRAVNAALRRFRELPGRKAYRIDAGDNGSLWSLEHRADASMFVGSAVKTFILTKFLQDVERGRLSEGALLAVDDDVRSLSSSVYRYMQGETLARNILEAMISHSDNTATDIALAQTTPARVRKLIAKAGLKTAKIPNSTRQLFSYLAGAPYGVDKGWSGMLKIEDGKLFGKPRSPINKRETMMCSANDFVDFYARALDGAFFQSDATLTEYKRILSMADAIARVVPAGHAAYAKGGSIEWLGFNCVCLPGQMIIAGTPVTFCFTYNWNGPSSDVPAAMAAFADAVSDVLRSTARRVELISIRNTFTD